MKIKKELRFSFTIPIHYIFITSANQYLLYVTLLFTKTRYKLYNFLQDVSTICKIIHIKAVADEQNILYDVGFDVMLEYQTNTFLMEHNLHCYI